MALRDSENVSTKTAELPSKDFYLSHVFKGHIYRSLKEYGKALDCFRRGSELSGRNPVCLAEVAHILALMGDRDEAVSILEEMKKVASLNFVSAHPFALVHLALGDLANAIQCLRRTFEAREAYVIFFATDPVYDSLRDVPEFLRLVEGSQL